MNKIKRRADETGGVEEHFCEEFIAFAVFHEVVGNGEDAEAFGIESESCSDFEHGAAEASDQGIFFDSDYEPCFADAGDHLLIDRLYKPCVDHADGNPVFAELCCSFDGLGEHRAAGDDCAIVSVGEGFGLSEHDWGWISGDMIGTGFGISNGDGR